MVERVTGCALLCAVCLSGAVAASEPAAIERLDRVGRALAAEDGWRATFDQEYRPVGMTVGEVAAGVVWLAWPDRALFHTGDPTVRLMGLEGRVARLVDLEAETCDEHALSDREWERFPLAALLDPEGALEHFDVVINGEDGLSLRPIEPGGVDRVELTIDDDGLPVEVVVVDPQGAFNRLRFSTWQQADRPPVGGWLPPPPRGVECVGDPGALD
jgi:hypothetical protein